MSLTNNFEFKNKHKIIENLEKIEFLDTLIQNKNAKCLLTTHLL